MFSNFEVGAPNADFFNTIGHNQKSRTTILMSVKPSKAEVA